MGKWILEWCPFQDGTDLLVLCRRSCHFNPKGQSCHLRNWPHSVLNHQRFYRSTLSLRIPWGCWLLPSLGNVPAQPHTFTLRKIASWISLILLTMQVSSRWWALRSIYQTFIRRASGDRKTFGKDPSVNLEKTLINEKQNSLILCIH